MSRLWILAAAVLFSSGGAAIKGNTLTVWQVASFRSLVAAIAMALIFPAARKGWTWRHALVGVSYAATLVLFVAANKLTTAANAIFLQSTAPGYLVLFGPLLLGEHLRRKDLLLLLAVSGGMALFFFAAEPARVTAPDPAAGNTIALISGATWSLTLVGLRWLSRKEPDGDGGLATVVIGNIFASLAALPLAVPVSSIEGRDIAVLLYLGLFQIGFAYYCLTRAVAHVSAFEAATLLLVEPALNPVWTWLVVHERPSAPAITGGIVILTATLVNTWRQSRVERQELLTKARPFGAA